MLAYLKRFFSQFSFFSETSRTEREIQYFELSIGGLVNLMSIIEPYLVNLIFSFLISYRVSTMTPAEKLEMNDTAILSVGIEYFFKLVGIFILFFGTMTSEVVAIKGAKSLGAASREMEYLIDNRHLFDLEKKKEVSKNIIIMRNAPAVLAQ